MLSVTILNDTLRPDSVVPSTLVFGEPLPVHNGVETPKSGYTLDKRASIAEETRQEIKKHITKVQIDRTPQ